MEDKTYEKETYKPVVYIVFGFLIILSMGIWLSFEFNMTAAMAVKIYSIITALFCIVMAYYINKTKRAYYITTFSFKDYGKMSDEERKVACSKLYKIFRLAFGLVIVYMLIGLLINTSVWLDMGVFTVATLWACIKG